MEATNGGLHIIQDYYPQSIGCEDCRKKFKLRDDEKTASAQLGKFKDGNYYLIDFGGAQKAISAIDITMIEEKLDYPRALKFLADKYTQNENKTGTLKQYELLTRELKPKETVEPFFFELKEEFETSDLKVIFAKGVLQHFDRLNLAKKEPSKEESAIYSTLHKTLERYKWSNLKSYSWSKDGKVYTILANDKFPIYLQDHGAFKKIYTPKNYDKQYRFRYFGSVPPNHVYGLDQVKQAYRKLQTENDGEEEAETGIKKLDSITIISGERDAMNIAALGYFPIWLNSETKGLSTSIYKQLSLLAKEIINIPDIDITGYKAGKELAIKFPLVKTVWLPSALKNFKDSRGNPSKDLKDFLDNYKAWDLEQMIKIPLRAQFWYRTEKQNQKGDTYFTYSLNETELYYFLWLLGVGLLENEQSKSGFEIVHDQNGIVKKLKPGQIKTLIINYLNDTYQSTEIKNLVYKTSALSEAALENLYKLQIDFKDNDQDYQYFFFQNKTIKVTADEILEFKHDKSGRNCWDFDLIEYDFKKIEKQFTWANTASETVIIDSYNSDNLFMQYLVGTSRMYWRKELEEYCDTLSEDHKKQYNLDNRHSLNPVDKQTGLSPLSKEEIQEQQEHLANRLFVLGYLLHRYKDQTKTWAIYAMDAKLSDDGASMGRSGKSLLFKGVRHILETVTLAGRNTKLTDNPHIYETVTSDTDLILVDDCHEHLKLDFFFTSITDILSINAKFVRQTTLSYDQSPKFVFTSNYAIPKLDNSLAARLIFSVFSDFFHEQSTTDGNDYRETRRVSDFIGKNLFDHFTGSEWNDFFNLCIQALQFYLSVKVKLNPPMAKIKQRNLKALMTDLFLNWADVYFSKESGRLDSLVIRKEAYEEFIKDTGQRKWMMQRFSSALKAYAEYNLYILNPIELQNKDGRVIRKNKIDNKTYEMIYFRTSLDKPLNDEHNFTTGFEESLSNEGDYDY